LLFAVLMGRVSRHWQVLAAAGLVPFTLVLIGSGARGPAIALLGTVILTVGVHITRPGNRLRALMIIGIIGIVGMGIIFSGLVPEAALGRFDILVNEAQADTSAQARRTVMEVAWRLFTDRPVIGWGTGSVSAFGAGRDQIYPHNVLLELAAETGLLGLGLFLGVVSMVMWRLLSKLSEGSTQEPLWLTLLATVLFMLLNAMVSGDLDDNRDLWLFAGIAIAATEVKKEA
jgi:O-antigen ligase